MVGCKSKNMFIKYKDYNLSNYQGLNYSIYQAFVLKPCAKNFQDIALSQTSMLILISNAQPQLSRSHHLYHPRYATLLILDLY